MNVEDGYFHSEFLEVKKEDPVRRLADLSRLYLQDRPEAVKQIIAFCQSVVALDSFQFPTEGLTVAEASNLLSLIDEAGNEMDKQGKTGWMDEGDAEVLLQRIASTNASPLVYFKGEALQGLQPLEMSESTALPEVSVEEKKRLLAEHAKDIFIHMEWTPYTRHTFSFAPIMKTYG